MPNGVPRCLRYEHSELRQDYRATCTLGTGSFGRVLAAEHLQSGQKVAIKMVDM